MRPFLLTSISAGVVIVIAIAGMVRTEDDMPSWTVSLLITAFTVMALSFVLTCAELLLG